jgi:hypothetical protein
MANRNFNRVQALDKEVKHLYGQFAVLDSTPLQVLNESRSAGIKSVTYNSVGNYSVVLGEVGGDSDLYPALYSVDSIILDGTVIGGTAGGVSWQLMSDSVATDGTFIIQALSIAGVAAAVRTADIIKLHIVVKNSNQSAVGVGDLT